MSKRRNHNRNNNKQDKDTRKESRVDNQTPVTDKGYNDPSWYATSPELLFDSSSLAFATPLGGTIDIGYRFDDNISYEMSSDLSEFSIPGVMALKLHPIPGISTDNSSALNVAARNLYTYIRHANSGHSNYDAPDLMLYMLAMDNLYSYYAFLTRIYGVARAYSQTNRYMPATLLQAMGVDYNEIIANLADFRYYINSFGLKLQSLCLPNTMSYFLRHMWMYSNVYADAPLSKAQLMMYVPAGFYQYNEFEGAGKLEFLPITTWSYNNIRNIGNSMLSKILESEDMNIMSGDILKAYTPSGVFKISLIAEDYTALPIFNPEVLSQFKNTVILPAPEQTTTAITQNTNNGALIINPEFKSFAPYNRAYLFSQAIEVPTPGDNMVASRLTSFPVASTFKDGKYHFTLPCAGSEICVDARIYYCRRDPSTSEWTAVESPSLRSNEVLDFAIEEDSDVYRICTTLNQYSKLSQFNQFPFVNLYGRYSDSETTGKMYLAGVYGEADNTIALTNYDIKKMHDTALLSMLNVPRMGAIAK